MAQETNQAQKTLEEAGELHAKKEHQGAETDLTKQKVVAAFAENMKTIAALPVAERTFAFAKMTELNPGIMERAAELDAYLDTLNLTRGLSLTPLGPVDQVTEASTVGGQTAKKAGRKKSGGKKSGKRKS